MAKIEILPEALSELDALPGLERKALDNALLKLHDLGEILGYPHSSQVQGTTLRELRPRRGNSPWRAFYRQLADGTIVVAAIGPEAMHNRRRFDRAVDTALARLAARESE